MYYPRPNTLPRAGICSGCGGLFSLGDRHDFCPNCGKTFCRSCLDQHAIQTHECRTGK